MKKVSLILYTGLLASFLSVNVFAGEFGDKIDKVSSESINSLDIQNATTDPSSGIPSENTKKKKSYGVLYRLKSSSSLQKTFNSRRNSGRKAESELDTRLGRHGIRKSRELKRKRRGQSRSIFHAEVTDPVDIANTLEKLNNDPNVDWAEENIIYDVAAVPNDPNWSLQAVHATATNLPNAWDLTTGSEAVVIGVIDTGVDYTHPDLVDNIWHNPAEIPNDGIDNDSNGFIDDVNGWDFVTVTGAAISTDDDPGPPDNDPIDVQGHGTHVSGIAAAKGNNGIGIAGVSWNSKIMPLRAGYKTPSGQGLLTNSDIIEALYYGCDNGVDIINMSFGSPYISKALEDALEYCADAGVFLVAAAGNSNTDTPHYPAAYVSVFSVAASDPSVTNRAPFSNYGVWVDIMAPGMSIYSTMPGNTYEYASGTSMASPYVVGMAALLKSVDPNASINELRDRLRSMSVLTEQPAIENVGSGKARLIPPMDNSVLTTKLRVGSVHSNSDNPAAGGIFLKPSVKNYSAWPENVSLTITTTDPYLVINDDTVVIGEVQANELGSQWSDTWHVDATTDTPQVYNATYQVHVMAGDIEVAVENHSIELNPFFKSKVNASQEFGGVRFSRPKFLQHPDNRVSVIYESNNDFGSSDIQIYHRIRDLQGNWSNPVSIPGIGNFRRHHSSAVVGADGKIHMVYKVHEGQYDVEAYYSSFDGGVDGGIGPLPQWQTQAITSGAGLHVNGSPRSGFSDTTIMLSSDNQPVVFWSDWRDGTADVYWSRYNGATWSLGERVADYDSTYEMQLYAYTLPDGRFILITSRYLENNPGYAHEYLIYDGAGWSLPQPITSDLSSIGFMNGSVMDENGAIHVGIRFATTTFHHFIFDGATWLEQPPLPVQQYASSEFLLMSNNIGGFDILFLDWKAGGTDSYLMRKQYDGVTWSATETLFYLGRDSLFIPNKIFGYSAAMVTQNGELLYANTIRPNDNLKLEVLSDLQWSSVQPGAVNVVDAGDTTLFPSISASYSTPDGFIGNQYRYSIGTAPGLADIRNWVSSSTGTSFSYDFTPIKTLATEQNYYVNVQAMTSGGYLSQVSSSDGIRYVEADSLAPIAPASQHVIKDQPVDGVPDSISTVTVISDGYGRFEVGIVKYDVAALPIDLNMTDAYFALRMGPNNSIDPAYRAFDVELFASETLSDFSDFDAPGEFVQQVSFTVPNAIDIRVPIAQQLATVLAAGTRYIGVRITPVGQVPPSYFVGGTLDIFGTWQSTEPRYNAPPQITIDNPIDGAIINANSINLTGSALDEEDGDLSTNISWSSDVDGNLGIGSDLTVKLSPGPHLITAAVIDSGGKVTSASVNITIILYCDSRGLNTSYEWIDSITLASNLLSSGNNKGYGDYTSTNVFLNKGANSVTLTPGFGFGAYTEYWRIWIDLNHNGVFDSSEMLYSGGSNKAITSSITIPQDALSGETRMRVSMQWARTPNACGNFTWGEVEDYTVTISE